MIPSAFLLARDDSIRNPQSFIIQEQSSGDKSKEISCKPEKVIKKNALTATKERKFKIPQKSLQSKENSTSLGHSYDGFNTSFEKVDSQITTECEREILNEDKAIPQFPDGISGDRDDILEQFEILQLDDIPQFDFHGDNDNVTRDIRGDHSAAQVES